MTSLAAAGGRSSARRGAGGLTDVVLAQVSRGHARACAFLLALALVCYLPGLASLQPMDRDEPRFAQATKQMLESGDFVDIRFQTEARHKKPVGIYWLQSATVAAAQALGIADARNSILFYRLPSLLGALATVLLTYWAALAFLARREAVLAAALVATSILLTVEAHLAKTDAVLTACAVAAMAALARAYLAPTRAPLPHATVLTFWIAVALGILVKGPMVPMFAGLCALVLCLRDRSGRWLMGLRPVLGLALTLLVVAPWFAAIAIRSGGAFFSEAVGHDMLGKVGTAQTQHWAPPGTYLVVFFATFWPGAAFVALAAPFAWARRSEDAVAFLIAWVLPSWIVFEAVPTKLPHYVLPLCPALAILAVLAITRGFVNADRRGSRWVAMLVPFIPIALTIALVAVAWRFEGIVPWSGLAVLVMAITVATVAWRLFSADRMMNAVAAAAAAGILVGPAVFGWVQPALAALKISPRLAAVRDGFGCANALVATVGYREPSLVFLIGTNLAMLDGGRDAASFLAQGGCRLAFVEKRFEPAFREAAGALVEPVARVAGFNINGGRNLDIAVYRVKP